MFPKKGSLVSASRGGLAFLVFLLLFSFSRHLAGAASVTVTATLDPQFISIGESATLAITFHGTNQQPAPDVPPVSNLQIRYVGPSSQISIVNGQVSATVTHNYSVTPQSPGDYVIPGIRIQMGGQTLSTSPLQLKALKPEAPSQQSLETGNQVAFLKMVVPQEQLYVGEVIAAELQLHVRAEIRGLEDFQLTAFPSEGLVTGKLVQGRQRQARLGNYTYNVIPLSFTVRALKTGPLSLGPASASLVVELPSRGRRDPFEFFSFGERKRLSLTSDTQQISGVPLPQDSVPASFSGAVGKYTMAVSVGPTNVTVGDPVTVRVEISGTGALDALALPEQTAWNSFKVYPATARVETSDPLGLQGTKTFEQVVAPEDPGIAALPAFSFSYFDPEAKSYRTLTHPPVPLSVRSAGATVVPSVAATNLPSGQQPPPREIVHLKPRPGPLAHVHLPLIQQPWFLALQAIPVIAWLSALSWRKRREHLERNPKLSRSRRLAQVLREGKVQLQRLAAEKDSQAFFATLFRLLQELLGERLDLPASAITEAVIEEELRPRGFPEPVLRNLHELFQACNVAKYAPVRTSQEMSTLASSFEEVANQLRSLRV